MLASFRKVSIVAPLFLFAAIGFAQTSNIQGDVTGPDGKPIADAAIKIDRIDIKGTYSVKTNQKGHFLYANLPVGTYNITVVVDGKEVANLKNARPKPGDNDPIVIKLGVAAAQSAAPAAATVTGTTKRLSLLPPKAGAQSAGLSIGGGVSAGAGLSAGAGVSAGAGPSALPGGQAKSAELTREDRERQIRDELERKAQEEAMVKNKALNDAFNAGIEAKNAKNYPVAIENFEKAVAMSPSQHVVWAHLAESYMSLGDSKSGAEQQEAFDKGIAAFATAVELKADDANYHNNYGLALAKVKKTDEAQAELAKAAQLDPAGAGRYFYNLGAVYVNIKQNDAAEAAFKKATEVDPTYADAYFQEALVLMDKVTLDKDGKMHAPAGTAEALQKYMALKPDGANAEAAKAILEELGSTVATSFQRPGEKQPAKSNQKKSQ